MYTLGAAGNRLSVAELSGRTVNYGYDSLYRLTSEAITNDPNNHNNTTQYQYDNVGNRQQLIVNGTTANVYSYDADDRLGSDQYDANGNTTSSGGTTSTYDFENHLVSKGGVTIVYDGDGNRVSETVAGVTTQYLVDTQNPTGYAQVVDEIQNGSVVKSYSYGLERISQRPTANGQGPSFYGYDGHGSVRFLTDSTGAVSNTYDFDAFGNLISSTGSTPNNYLFASEQYDPALGLYYNRARYLSTTTGRFWSVDTQEGQDEEPLTLHKYAYAGNDAVDRLDPSGNDFSIGEVVAVAAIVVTLSVVAGPEPELASSGGKSIGQLIADKAASYRDSFQWQQICNLDHGIPQIHPETCNLFVYDVLKEVGAAPPLFTRNTIRARLYETFRKKLYQTPPLAQEWADPSFNIPDWDLVPGGAANAQPGDVIAEQHHNDAGGVSGGHSGIVVGPRMTASSAFQNPATGLPVFGTILINDWGFRTTSPNGTGLMKNSVVRRYIHADDKP